MTTGLAALEPGFIPRAPVLPRSQDYSYLRARGLQYIERLAHREWTDYNVHDPGVTILELLCYAITDLGLRAAYPMRDLLAPLSPATASASDVHLANQILVSRPVSFDDLRRVLIDIPGVRNAWVERHRGVSYALDLAHGRLMPGDTAPKITLNGLLDVYLEYEDFVAPGDPQYRAQSTAGPAEATGPVEYVAAAFKGLEFEALEDARLESVTIFPGQAGTFVLRLKHRRDSVAQKAITIAPADVGTAVVVPLDFVLKAGLVYRLGCTDATSVTLRRTKQAIFPMPAPPAEGPVHILRGYANGSTPEAGRQSYYFYYNWKIAHDSSGLTEREVRAKAIERIHKNRNLCEDVVNVCTLKKEEVAVCADIELRADADTDAVHAEILYRLYRFVSPIVPFHSLDELRARGKTIDEIFDGPALDHGFIDGDELKALSRRCEIHASDVVQILMDIDGVTAIKSLKLLKVSDPTHPEDWILPLSTDRTRIGVFAPWQSKLTFYKRGLPYLTNKKAVEPLFTRKKAADVEDKLLVRTRELAAPVGEWRNVGAYEPIANELPITYRVGRIVVRDSDPIRQAQSRQLTAYLLFFDQILANYLAQLSHVGDLFTWRDVGFRTYFTQQIRGVHGIDAIRQPDGTEVPGALDGSANEGFASLKEGLESIVESAATAAARRLQFLEHLAARYAEEFDEYKAMMRGFIRAAIKNLPAWTGATPYVLGARVSDGGIEYECLRAHTSVADQPPREMPDTWRQQSRLIRQVQRFLNDYPALSAGRGMGFDWRQPFEPTNVAGYQRRIYRLLDIDPVERTQLAGHRLVIRDTDTATGHDWHFELQDEDGSVLFSSVICQSKSSIEALLDLSLRLGADRTNYQANPAGTMQLVQICDQDHQPDPLGDLAPGKLTDVITYFKQVYASEGFHLIEHILLRRRTEADSFLPVQLEAPDECCPAVRDPYSFRVSIVLPSWSPRFRDMKFRRLVEDTLRRECPAHIYPRICWVNHEQMKNLEIALADWEHGLASLAREPGACVDDDATFTGRLPLPAADTEYAALLERMIDELYHLTNVYPLAQIHDCEEVDGDTPQITLGNTSLGTL